MDDQEPRFHPSRDLERQRAPRFRPDELNRNIKYIWRPVFFSTENMPNWPHFTRGGTIFLIYYLGRVFGVSCAHVLRDVFQSPDRLIVPSKKYNDNGELTASGLRIHWVEGAEGDAEDSDIEDMSIVIFPEYATPRFFNNDVYPINDFTLYAKRKKGNLLHASGVLKAGSNMNFDDEGKGSITWQECNLMLRDDGQLSDKHLRWARGDSEFSTLNCLKGMSGAPVFDVDAWTLCGMIMRGNAKNGICNVIFIDIVHIIEFARRCLIEFEKNPPVILQSDL